MTDIVKRLRDTTLPVCPFDRRSPDYWTTSNDKPCHVCGGTEAVDKCRGADLRIMDEAADTITALRTALAAADERAEKASMDACYAEQQRDRALESLGESFQQMDREQAEWLTEHRRAEHAESLVARFVEACGPFVRLEWPHFGVKDNYIAVVRIGALRLGDFRALASLTAEAKGK